MHICPNCLMAVLLALPVVGGLIRWIWAKRRVLCQK